MSFDVRIRPRISDTDMMGHVNNVAVVAWLEEGRVYASQDAFALCGPRPPLLLAHLGVDYLAQMYFGREVLIRTFVERMGSSSVTLGQEVIQDGKCCVRAKSVLVHFSPETGRSAPMPDAIRAEFEKLLGKPD